MNVLITGAGGQLGRALTVLAPPEVIVRGVTHAELDIADAARVDAVLDDFKPALLVTAAAFTRVDAAETAPTAAERANATGPATCSTRSLRTTGSWRRASRAAPRRRADHRAL